MATSLDTLSLSQMLDVPIGTPEKGAIHFAATRKLLQAVLEHLNMQYLTSEEPWPGHLSGSSLADVNYEVKVFKKEMENYKEHMSKVEALPSPLGTPPPDSPSLLPQTAVLGSALTALAQPLAGALCCLDGPQCSEPGWGRWHRDSPCSPGCAMGCPWQGGALWGVAALAITSDIPGSGTVSQVLCEEIGGIKAETSHISEDLKTFQEAQVCADHCGSTVMFPKHPHQRLVSLHAFS